MHLDEIGLEANNSYIAEGCRPMGNGATLTNFNIGIETDEVGRVRSYTDGLCSDRFLADMWDYRKIRNVETGESWDLRLGTAAQNGDLELAKTALAEGADVHLRTKQGATALHWAAVRGRGQVAELLLAHGADVNAVDDLGWLPAFLAAQNGFPAIAEMLVAHGSRVACMLQGVEMSLATGKGPSDDDLVEAAEAGDLPAVRSAIAVGADVNGASRDGWTPLLIAVNKGTMLVELLLAHGADPNLPSDRGYTPLMRAAGLGKGDIVRILLAAGADKSLRDCDGKNAAQLAFEMGHGALARMVE